MRNTGGLCDERRTIAKPNYVQDILITNILVVINNCEEAMHNSLPHSL